MPARRHWAVAAFLVGIVVAGAVASSVPAATSARDRTPPTKPGNLRVTAKTQSSVSLAWNASNDNSGDLRYVVHLWQDPATATLPRTQTSYTWTGLRPNVQYYFWVEAVDASGNNATSDLVTVTTDPDRSAPTAPGSLRVTGVTASQVSLAWDASTDDVGIAEYLVSVSPLEGAITFTGPTSATIVGLAPSATYTFAVRARDLGYNVSPFSNTVTATTLASTDTQPPTAPSDLVVWDLGCGEVWLFWTQSTDDQDPQVAIRYQVFINGVFDPLGSVTGVGRTITYVVDGSNTLVVRAVDSAGNVSAASNAVTLTLDDCL